MEIAEFSKISRAQFVKDLKKLCGLDEDCYEDIRIPQRATAASAGYDFVSPIAAELAPGESIRIPTGIRCCMEKEYVLQLYPRSSLGFKYQLGLLNTVGIIDADYYFADNEGHIIVGIVNHGDKIIKIAKGDRFVQGVFYRYYLASEEDNGRSRHGGFGSTD